MTDATPITTPMNPYTNLMCIQPSDDQHANMKSIAYAELVSGLNYISIISQPDNQFATSILAHFMAGPTHAHWEATWYNLWYLKGTKLHCLVLNVALSDGLKPYTDCNWASSMDHQSILGAAFLVNGGTISWYSCKQTMVMLSTCNISKRVYSM
jgi:hypothetical protein